MCETLQNCHTLSGMTAGEWRSAVHTKLEEIAMKLDHLSPQGPGSPQSRSPSPQQSMLEADYAPGVASETPWVWGPHVAYRSLSKHCTC
jgi:hypothetical protein